MKALTKRNERILSLYEKSLSYRDIADRIGCSYGTVCGVIYREHLRRSSGQKKKMVTRVAETFATGSSGWWAARGF